MTASLAGSLGGTHYVIAWVMPITQMTHGGAGRPPQPFQDKRFQGFALGPKNTLGLKIGLRDAMGSVRQWTVEEESSRFFASTVGPPFDREGAELRWCPQGQVEANT